MQWRVHRSRSLEMDVKIGGHGAWRLGRAGLFHQMDCRGPVAVAIEECAADTAIEHPVEGLMVRLRTPFANEVIAFGKAANAKSFVVRRSATEASIVRR